MWIPLIMLILTLIIFVIFCININKSFFKPVKIPTNKIDINSYKSICREINIKSENNYLNALLLGERNTKGIVVFSNDIGLTKEYFISEAIYFVKQGYQVLLYDYRGTYKSTGKYMGFNDSVSDLSNIIRYASYNNNNIILFGHSLGGYTSLIAASLTPYKINKIITVNAFNREEEIIKKLSNTYGSMKRIIYKVISFVQKRIYKDKYNLKISSIINSLNSNILIIHGVNDNFVNIENSVYSLNEYIKEENIEYLLEENERSNHFDIIHNKNELNNKNEDLLKHIIDFIEK